MDQDNRFSGTRVEAQALREELFHRASIGELTGDQADAEAVRLGLGSLSRRPGPEEFRPEVETYWTLSMAVAWIAYLDLDEVREWSAPYRAECFDWRWQRSTRFAQASGLPLAAWRVALSTKPYVTHLSVNSSDVSLPNINWSRPGSQT